MQPLPHMHVLQNQDLSSSLAQTCIGYHPQSCQWFWWFGHMLPTMLGWGFTSSTLYDRSRVTCIIGLSMLCFQERRCLGRFWTIWRQNIHFTLRCPFPAAPNTWFISSGQAVTTDSRSSYSYHNDEMFSDSHGSAAASAGSSHLSFLYDRAQGHCDILSATLAETNPSKNENSAKKPWSYSTQFGASADPNNVDRPRWIICF